MAESEEELKRFLMRVKEDSEKAGLKFNIQKTKTMAYDPITSQQTDGEKVETVTDFIFLGSKITAELRLQNTLMTVAMKKMLAPWKESYDKPRWCIKGLRHHFVNKGPQSQSNGLPSSHVQMWELDHKKGWVLKNWLFQTVVLEKSPESPLDRKDIKSIIPKGDRNGIFIGRTDPEAPILWQPDAKSWLIGKDPDSGKDWRQEKNVTTEDEMIGWYHQLNGCESE